MALDLTKPIKTRDGNEVRIYATDGKVPYSIHGAVLTNGAWKMASWIATGEELHNGIPSSKDLVNVPQKRTLSGWLNVYPIGVAFHPIRDEAELFANPTRVACIPFEYEYEEK